MTELAEERGPGLWVVVVGSRVVHDDRVVLRCLQGFVEFGGHGALGAAHHRAEQQEKDSHGQVEPGLDAPHVAEVLGVNRAAAGVEADVLRARADGRTAEQALHAHLSDGSGRLRGSGVFVCMCMRARVVVVVVVVAAAAAVVVVFVIWC